MNEPNPFIAYQATVHRALFNLQNLQDQTDDWIREHHPDAPSLESVAFLAGLNMKRQEELVDLQSAEDALIAELIRRLKYL